MEINFKNGYYTYSYIVLVGTVVFGGVLGAIAGLTTSWAIRRISDQEMQNWAKMFLTVIVSATGLLA